MALTEMEVRNAKPGAKIAKLSDGGGLQLWISPDGAKRAPNSSGHSRSC
jgi:hypothetical protein